MPKKRLDTPLTAPPAELSAVQWYDLDELIIWDDNYNEGDIGSIAGSIRRFGFANDPRVWQGANVRGGNHTVEALRTIKRDGARAGDLYYPPARVRVEGDKWFIVCADISYLSADDAVAFAIADNEHARKSSRDDQKLLEYLQKMDEGTRLAAGFDNDDIDFLARMLLQQDLPPNDPNAEWVGMPEFEHGDLTGEAAFTIRVFLKDVDDLAAFSQLIGKDLTGKKFFWFSKQPIGDLYEVYDEMPS